MEEVNPGAITKLIPPMNVGGFFSAYCITNFPLLLKWKIRQHADRRRRTTAASINVPESVNTFSSGRVIRGDKN